jgi:hypothetical protein
MISDRSADCRSFNYLWSGSDQINNFYFSHQ